jgi:hypothetical protein
MLPPRRRPKLTGPRWMTLALRRSVSRPPTTQPRFRRRRAKLRLLPRTIQRARSPPRGLRLLRLALVRHRRLRLRLRLRTRLCRLLRLERVCLVVRHLLLLFSCCDQKWPCNFRPYSGLGLGRRRTLNPIGVLISYDSWAYAFRMNVIAGIHQTHCLIVTAVCFIHRQGKICEIMGEVQRTK